MLDWQEGAGETSEIRFKEESAVRQYRKKDLHRVSNKGELSFRGVARFS